MTAHPRTFADYAAAEVEAARRDGLYTVTWDHKARSQGGAQPGVVNSCNLARATESRRCILEQVAKGNCMSTSISAATGRSVNSTTHRMNSLRDEGLLTLVKGTGRAATTAAITDAGRAWLAEHGGEA